MCSEKWIVYDNWQWPDQLRGWTKKKFQSTSQSQTCTKSHGHCLVVCCWSDPLRLSESQWYHYIWEVCSANRWDAPKTVTPAAGNGQQKGPGSSRQRPTAHHTTSASEVEQIGLRSFASSTVFTWPLANQLPLLQASQQSFCKEDASTTSRRQKMLSKSSSNPEAWIFTLQE